MTPPASLLAPLSEVLRGVLRDRRVGTANLLQVRTARGEYRLGSQRKVCMVRFHTTTTVRLIDPFKLHLSGAAPPGLQSCLFNRIVYESELVLVNDSVCCRSRLPRLRTCGNTDSVTVPNKFGSRNFTLLYALVSCAFQGIGETHLKQRRMHREYSKEVTVDWEEDAV